MARPSDSAIKNSPEFVNVKDACIAKWYREEKPRFDRSNTSEKEQVAALAVKFGRLKNGRERLREVKKTSSDLAKKPGRKKLRKE